MRKKVVDGQIRSQSRRGRTALDRRIEALLARIRSELTPEQARDYLAINMATGEYVVGKTPVATTAAYDARWPEGGFYRCRVDGSPFGKLYRSTAVC